MTPGALLNLTRTHTAGWEVLVFLLGPAIVGYPLMSREVSLLAVLAVLVNGFIFVVNDLADLPRDRLNPDRASSPLVSEAVTPNAALALACALPIAMWLLIALAEWPRKAEVAFALLLLLGAYLCVYQKSLPGVHPLVLDSMFGLTMAGPVPVAIASVGMPIPTPAWAIAGAFGVLCVGLNVIGGNLKDLDADMRSGFRTTSIAFGVHRATDGTAVTFTPSYLAFGYCVVALTSSLSIAAVLTAHSQSTVVVAATTGAIILLALGMAGTLWQLFSGRRPPARRGRDPFFAFGILAILVAANVSARPDTLLAMVTFAVLWDFLFRWPGRSQRQHAQPGKTA